ncbi:MAG: hypothetical protein WDO74_28520 [Pseudomonadota bacterium]
MVKKGDKVMVLPSRRTSTVIAIDTFDGEKEQAFAPMSVTLRLADEIDISRGDMLVHPDNLPHVAQRFETMLVWLSRARARSSKELPAQGTPRKWCAPTSSTSRTPRISRP